MKKENEFVLPEKWCVKHHPETLEWIRNNAEHNGTSINKSSYYYFPCDDSYSNYSHNFPFGGYSEITFEQFKEHVLKEIPKPEYEPKDVAFKIVPVSDLEVITTHDNLRIYEPNPITLDDIKSVYSNSEFNSQKKILGYKLIKPEYKEVARLIALSHLSEYFIKNYTEPFEYIGLANEGKCKMNLEEAGVMHWFEAVYDTSITLKSGVKLSEDDIAEVRELIRMRKVCEDLAK